MSSSVEAKSGVLYFRSSKSGRGGGGEKKSSLLGEQRWVHKIDAVNRQLAPLRLSKGNRFEPPARGASSLGSISHRLSIHRFSEVKIMSAFGKLKNALVPFRARFSSDVNLWENQVVALLCMEWESSQSFPRVTLSLTLLQCLHGNQRLASKLSCLLNLPTPCFSLLFSTVKNEPLFFYPPSLRPSILTLLYCFVLIFFFPCNSLSNLLLKSSIQLKK